MTPDAAIDEIRIVLDDAGFTVEGNGVAIRSDEFERLLAVLRWGVSREASLRYMRLIP